MLVYNDSGVGKTKIVNVLQSQSAGMVATHSEKSG